LKDRRSFIKDSAFAGLAAFSAMQLSACDTERMKNDSVILATWAPNTKAVEAAQKALKDGKGLLSAIEEGIWVPESDPKDMSVGYGGLPDRDGKVTLDACIMNGDGRCGSVLFMEHIKHPISVARKVMENTPHLYLAGQGALEFALAQGFEKENLLSSQSKEAYEKWLGKGEYDPLETSKRLQEMIQHQHDTIGLLIRGADGQLAGGCSTSGLAYKIRGRVGDSPIIGAGLYADNEAGAATATGVGEEIARVCGAHLIVELMRQGKTPEAACRIAVERIYKWNKDRIDAVQVGFIAVNKAGDYGAYAMHANFSYVVSEGDQAQVLQSDFLVK
jgi:N4-(beta-N-acetylglucosaminyl)-L-asparaginase